MLPVIRRASRKSLNKARQLAEKVGVPFDERQTAETADRLLTLYFKDIVGALSPEFDHIPITEYSQYRVNAHAGRGKSAFIHVDQMTDIWIGCLSQLWTIRAMHVLTEKGRAEFNAQFLRVLDMRDAPDTLDDVLEEMWPAFLEHTDELNVSNELTTWSFAFIACHELAHHDLDHVGREGGLAFEFEADRRGYEIFSRVCRHKGPHGTLRWQPYAPNGAFVALSLFDLSERRRAQRVGLSMRIPSETHPFASDRWERLRPSLLLEPNEYVHRFHEGFGAALADIGSDLGLSDIG